MWGKRKNANFKFSIPLILLISLNQVFSVSAADNDNDDAPYAPSSAQCPSYFVNESANIFDSPSESFSFYSQREAVDISEIEKSWVKSKNEKTTPNLINWFKQLDMKDYSKDEIEDHINSLDYDIKIALAFSGGGYRAMLSGAGQLAALDNNTKYEPSNKSAASTNKLGGILQSSTYISALSGGSWLLSSLVFDDWSSVQDILDGKTEIWNLTTSILNQTTNLTYFTNIISIANEKQEAGLNINATLVDVYGIYISTVLFSNKPNNGLNLTWSGIRDLDSFKNFEMPYPLITTIGGNTDKVETFYYNSFEVTPFEIGSWSPEVNCFSDTKYFGSKVDEMGMISNSDECTVQLDTATFLLGSSSNIFPSFFYPNGSAMPLDSSSAASSFASDISLLATLIDQTLSPVPFGVVPINLANNNFALYQGADSGFLDNGVDETYLIDGGSFSESIPIDPFLQPVREVDVIFAFDNSDNDDENWPDGTTLEVTKERLTNLDSQIVFYDIPENFTEEGLNTRPVFFGCNGSDLLSFQNYNLNLTRMTPLLIYMPNSYVSFLSNVSTLKLSYTDEEKFGMIQNGFDFVTRSNYTLDEEFAECIGCAILRRSQERKGVEQGDQCAKCFERYCYFSEDAEAEEEKIPQTDETLDYFSSKIPAYNANVFEDGSTTSESSSTSTKAGSVSSSSSTSSSNSGSGSGSGSSASGASETASSTSSSSSKGGSTNLKISSLFMTISLLLVSIL